MSLRRQRAADLLNDIVEAVSPIGGLSDLPEHDLHKRIKSLGLLLGAKLSQEWSLKTKIDEFLEVSVKLRLVCCSS